VFCAVQGISTPNAGPFKIGDHAPDRSASRPAEKSRKFLRGIQGLDARLITAAQLLHKARIDWDFWPMCRSAVVLYRQRPSHVRVTA
jgi:hypothetical protein